MAANLSELSPSVQFPDGEEINTRHSCDVRPLSTHEEESEGMHKIKSLPLRKSKTTDSYSKPGYRRSLASFAERLRGRSRPQSMIEEDVAPADSNNADGTSSRPKLNDEDYKFKYSGRRSSDFSGAYADVARAQAIYMEKLREEQEKKNIKTNADGLPIPPPMGSRRSSMTHVLGMHKALLAR
ncbi:hypothetical protein BGZ65_003619 [Modicella reniformis]|uniref:Uncharacterized protein n=1 Tax=Modicella reniformis TaxID=1440133 RepID=A0A9P6ILL2_9FUNG|nr:hypothetical protein BGZ65_003619 [Modicella reniformis]